MIGEIKVALVQMASKQAVYDEGAKEENVGRIAANIAELAPSHDLLVFPELATTGYIPLGYSATHKLAMWNRADDPESSPAFARLVEATKGTECLVIFGFAQRSDIKYEFFDSAALAADGALLGVHRKVHPGGEEGHYFIAGGEPAVFDTRLGRVGVGICYDMVFPELSRVLAIKGAELIVFTCGWANLANLRLYGAHLPVARALENQCHVIFCNGAGSSTWKEYTIDFYGESRIVSATGEVLATGRMGEEAIVEGLLRRRELEKAVAVLPIFRDRHIEAYGPITQPYR